MSTHTEAARFAYNGRGWLDRDRARALTLDDAESGSHQGPCEDDIAALRRVPYIKEQLDALDAGRVRAELRRTGGWDDAELSDEEQNLDRLLWIACGQIREENR